MTSATHHTLIVSDVTAVFDQKEVSLSGVEPYVVLKTGEYKVHSKASKTYEWRESFVLEKFHPATTTLLEAEVFDKRTLLPDTLLGSGLVDLATKDPSYLDGKSQRIIVPLTNKKNVPTGSLSFYVNAGNYKGRGSLVSSGVGVTSPSAASHTATAGSGATSATGVAASAGAGAASATQGVQYGGHTGQKLTRKSSSSSSSSSSSQENIGTIAAAGQRRTATATAGATAAEGEVVDRKYYTGHEDRPREQALVEKVREHQPFVQQYETTVQHTGRERQVGSQLETLGTTERVLGANETVDRKVHDIINPNLPAGAAGERVGGPGWQQGRPGPVCDVQTFEVTGDRAIDKERVTGLREHRDFEKEFEIKTKLAGQHYQNTAQEELVDRQRVLLDEKSKNACEGHPDASAVVGSATSSGAAHQSGHDRTQAAYRA